MWFGPNASRGTPPRNSQRERARQAYRTCTVDTTFSHDLCTAPRSRAAPNAFANGDVKTTKPRWACGRPGLRGKTGGTALKSALRFVEGLTRKFVLLQERGFIQARGRAGQRSVERARALARDDECVSSMASGE